MAPLSSLLLVLIAAEGDESVSWVDLMQPPAIDDDLTFRFRVSAGPEWDTNAKRAVPNTGASPLQNASRPTDVVADGLLRLTVDTRAQLDIAPGHTLSATYVLAAKRFFRESTEDLLVNNLSVFSSHTLTDWLYLSVYGNGRLSRIRSGSRDYNLGFGQSAFTLRLHDDFDVDLRGRVTGFGFPVESNFAYVGPAAGGVVRYRPMRGMTLSVSFDWNWRFYDGNALATGVFTDENGNMQRTVTFCEPEDQANPNLQCVPRGKRQDEEAQAAFNISYRGPFVIGGGYLLRVQRSNAELEDVDRHRLSFFATFGLPLDLIANVTAALQVNNGVSNTDTKFLAEDDENQNSLQVGLSYLITDSLQVEARYALFANQFATNDVSFIRHTVYVGVGYHAGS